MEVPSFALGFYKEASNEPPPNPLDNTVDAVPETAKVMEESEDGLKQKALTLHQINGSISDTDKECEDLSSVDTSTPKSEADPSQAFAQEIAASVVARVVRPAQDDKGEQVDEQRPLPLKGRNVMIALVLMPILAAIFYYLASVLFADAPATEPKKILVASDTGAAMPTLNLKASSAFLKLLKAETALVAKLFKRGVPIPQAGDA